jgi:cell wall-associated NlpC family hydrolase
MIYLDNRVMHLYSVCLTSPAATLRRTFTGVVLATAALACNCALAQSQSEANDDMALFLQDKGLINKLGEQVTAAGKAVGEKASELVIHAMGFLGVPYKRGGNSLETGLDCSGFVRLIYEQTVGLMLPRRSAEQAAATMPIEKSELQPGDLVFFNTLKSAFSHVGIYVGDNKFIHSPRTGAVVRVEDMRVAYWQQRFDGARRVDPSKANQAASVRNQTNTPR